MIFLEFTTGSSTCLENRMGNTSEYQCDYFFSHISSTTTAEPVSTSTLNTIDPITATLLMIILVSIWTLFFITAFSYVAQKRKFLWYSGGDVEVRQDL